MFTYELQRQLATAPHASRSREKAGHALTSACGSAGPHAKRRTHVAAMRARTGVMHTDHRNSAWSLILFPR
jgi:hypothetical protein